MSKKISKIQANKEIKDFFSDVKDKTPKDVKKIKNLAKSQNIKLGDKRKLFCKTCLTPYKRPSVRMKGEFITIICETCEHKNRWKFKGDLNFGIKNRTIECC